MNNKCNSLCKLLPMALITVCLLIPLVPVISLNSVVKVEASSLIDDKNLAGNWSPFWYQETEDMDPTNNVDYRADYVTNFDFDTNWDGTNNWENVTNFDLPAYLYYWIVETETNWFIGYSAYYPRQWCISGDLNPQFENEMTGCLVIIKKDGSAYGQFLALITFNPILEETESYIDPDNAPSNAVTNGHEDIDGYLEMIGGSHPKIYVTAGQHIISAEEDWIDGFPSGHGLIYMCGENHEVPQESDNTKNGNFIRYELKSINDLWQLRDPDAYPKVFSDFGIFPDGSKAPWAWDDFNDGVGMTPQDFFMDPYDLVDNYFDGLNSPFSKNCIHRSYLKFDAKILIVTVDGLDVPELLYPHFINFAPRKNYLEAALQSIDHGTNEWEIVPYRWLGDADDTPNLVKDLGNVLVQQYTRSKTNGWKFVVVSHSWGTVLSYVALSQRSGTVQPDLFITLSSPLGTVYANPQPGLAESAVIQYTDWHLDDIKPPFSVEGDFQPNCENYLNFWAMGDVVSGPLPAADYNKRVDPTTSEDDRENLFVTEDYHKFTSLQRGGSIYNGVFRYYIRDLISSTSVRLQAFFTADSYEGYPGAIISFSTSESKPWYGESIVSYSWEFDDPHGVTSGTDINPIHTFSNIGEHNVTLTVTDSSGFSDSYSRIINIHNPLNPSFAISNYIQGPAPQTISFDASSSTNALGTIDTYQWDFADPQSGSLNTDSGILTSHYFSNNGYYLVTLTITGSGYTYSIKQSLILGNSGHPTYIPAGTIDYNTTWATYWSPYVLEGNITIANGYSLTIKPGVTVKLMSSYFDIRGTLIADGNSENPIIFTSLKDDFHGGDTNEDGNATFPAAGDYFDIHFLPESSNNVLNHVIVKYGGNGYDQYGIRTDTSDLTILNSIVSDTYNNGIGIFGASPIISDNSIVNNIGGGIYLSSGNPKISNNNISNNTSWAIYIADPSASGSQITGNTISGPFPGIFVKQGSISSNTEWSSHDAPYVVGTSFSGSWQWYEQLIILEGATLTIDPGVIVKFKAHAQPKINGTLVVNGTAEQPVTFTSIKDDGIGGDTNQDGAASSPSPGDWGGFIFGDSGNNDFIQCAIIKYAEYGIINNSIHLTIRNSNISLCSGEGLALSGTSTADIIGNNISNNGSNGIAVECNANITGNTIGNNGNDGIYVNSSIPVINENYIFGNKNYGINNTNNTLAIDAENNWWGDASGPLDASDDTLNGGLFNPNGLGNTVSDYVDYAPWLTTAQKLETTILLISSLNPAIHGQIVIFTVYVHTQTPSEFIPSGSLSLYDDTDNKMELLSSADIINGSTVFTISNLSINEHTIKVNYEGDNNFEGNIGTLKEYVGINTVVTHSTIQNGTAQINQSIGIIVDISGSDAPNWTDVIICSVFYGDNQPSGSGTLQLGGTQYYDVKIISTEPLGNDATAKISITSENITQTATMGYWDGNNWIKATNISVTGTSISGDIPVSALGGTPIVIVEGGNPINPIPELPTGLLLGLGLIGIGVYLAMKKIKFIRIPL